MWEMDGKQYALHIRFILLLLLHYFAETSKQEQCILITTCKRIKLYLSCRLRVACHVLTQDKDNEQAIVLIYSWTVFFYLLIVKLVYDTDRLCMNSTHIMWLSVIEARAFNVVRHKWSEEWGLTAVSTSSFFRSMLSHVVGSSLVFSWELRRLIENPTTILASTQFHAKFVRLHFPFI